MRRLALIAAAALLAACQPPEPNSDAAPTPTPTKAQSDYRSELRLAGTEPFWGVRITSGQITLMRPDYADLTVTHTGPVIDGETAVWSGEGLIVRLEPDDCSDGMSDNRYPYAATVSVDDEVLKGCAARADEWPKGEG